MAPGGVAGSFLGQAHPVFDLGEDLFDRIVVGEQGSRYQSPAPVPRIIRPMEADLCEPRWSMTTMSPGLNVGTSICST